MNRRAATRRVILVLRASTIDTGPPSAVFITIIVESNFRYRQLHEQPDNGKGHAGSNARINVQCSEFVMQLARSVRRACLERGGGSRVQDERRCPRPCLNADSDALHYRRLGRRRMSPARPWPCSPYHKYHGFCTHEPPVPGPPVIIHCSKEVKAQLLPPRPV